MSICAIADRTILLNITNMDDRGGETRSELTTSGDNAVREAKGVKAAPTPPAASPMVLNPTLGAQPDGDGVHCRSRPGNTTTRKDFLRSMHDRSGKFGSGSGSGDQEICNAEDGVDPAAKKRKTRRGKPKHRKPKPYSKQQMSYEQRLRCRTIGRLTKKGGQPPAPYNTTQFLMEDHSDLPDLEQKLADAVTAEVPASFQKPLAPPRTRDSSFSIDSDEDYFYSSPEDEEEFLTKEFSSAYEDLHAERLSTLSKTELIQEYVQLEAKLDMMTKRLRGKSFQQLEERESEKSKNRQTADVAGDAEIAKKLKICQQRIDDLIQQNEQLRRDNEALRAKSCGSPVSSVDSESDSDSTSNGNRSSCGCSGGSPGSPKTGKSYGARQENDRRRSKRMTSVDSEGESTSTGSSKDSPAGQPQESPKSYVNDLSNGNSAGREIGGLPT